MDFKTASHTNGFAKYAAAITVKSMVSGLKTLSKPQQFKPAVKTSTRPVNAVKPAPLSDTVMAGAQSRNPRARKAAVQNTPPPSQPIPATKNAFQEAIL